MRYSKMIQMKKKINTIQHWAQNFLAVNMGPERSDQWGLIHWEFVIGIQWGL